MMNSEIVTKVGLSVFATAYTAVLVASLRKGRILFSQGRDASRFGSTGTFVRYTLYHGAFALIFDTVVIMAWWLL